MSSNKRNRSKNFSDEEALSLIHLVSQNKNIIENKLTNAVTNQEKNKAWKKITDEFNGDYPLQQRTAEQLISKYENLKAKARKYAAAMKQNTYATGGGPSTATTPDIVLDAILELINRKGVEGEDSLVDKDYMPAISVIQVEEADNQPIEVYMDLSNSEIEFENSVVSPVEAIMMPNNSKVSQPAKKPKFSKKKKEPQDVESVLQAKTRLYNEKARLLELEGQEKEVDIELKKIQVARQKAELDEYLETKVIRLALLEEDLKQKKLLNFLKQQELQQHNP